MIVMNVSLGFVMNVMFRLIMNECNVFSDRNVLSMMNECKSLNDLWFVDVQFKHYMLTGNF